mgnify:CR=1 FL=1
MTALYKLTLKIQIFPGKLMIRKKLCTHRTMEAQIKKEA